MILNYNKAWGVSLILFALLLFQYVDATVECARCRSSKEQNAPGIGLGFSMGYGTAAIKFLNGTVLDVSKVIGSTAYVTTMEEIATEATRIRAGGKSTLLGLNMLQLPSSSPPSVKQRFQQLFSWTLPSTLTDDKWTIALIEMTVSLRSAVEAVHNIEYPDIWISTPNFILDTDDHLLRPFFLAIDRARMSVNRRLSAGIATMREVDGIFNCYDIYLNETSSRPDMGCEYHNGVRLKTVLSIDYSDQSLGLTLHIRNDGIFLPDLARHDEYINLGARMSTGFECANEYWMQVKEALQVYTRTPGYDVNHVVLSGDRATDRQFLAVMEDVFKSNDQVKDYQKDENSHVFASARQACREARIGMMGGYDGCVPGPSCPRGKEKLPWEMRWQGPAETEAVSFDAKKGEL